MAQMYFSKVNINSEIFSVYKDENLKNRILDDAFNKMNTEESYEEKDNNALDGEEILCRYKFCDLEKDYTERTITGRLVKIYPAEIQSYNSEKDTVDTKKTNDSAASCTFYFDARTEQIAFITRNNFGYNQFNNYFKILLEKIVKDISFELFLETNIMEFKEKIKRLQKILSMDVIIVPPNANTYEFQDLFGITAQEFEESGATIYEQKLQIPSKAKRGLNVDGSFFERMFFGVGKGYGEMTVKGKNKDNLIQTITSKEDAPHKEPIPDEEKDSIIAFRERAKEFVLALVARKNMLKIRELDSTLEEGTRHEESEKPKIE